ncbi:CmcJ/NvfI family oxidoreductase [Bradyrhizobium sp. 33ap4]|uniref:CmcJ/NvfI family oxidoreductase n=1 Tax=Bradyrhizobium sp. 33ap4 TaxID=3061630 RepID=UPI00292D38CF|nr:CmcJ/NvfI family oxidoreductase [Bradyrhizobium sp. 33ap4]
MGNTKQASPTAQESRDCLEGVKGQIHFARRTSDEKAPEVSVSALFPKMLFGHIGEPPPMLTYDVIIRNARPIVNEFTLDREGFTLIRHKPFCANECDPEIMRDKYLEEMVPFIRNYFHASWVIARRGSVIARAAGGSSISGVKDPVALAHIDYVPIDGPVLAAITSQLEGVPIRSYSRLMVIQAWHALSPPPQDFPLAFCDGASFHDADIDAVDYAALGTTIKFGFVHFNPTQRWYYFPAMTADELILFKSYDSEVHCNPKTAHSAFDNRPACPNATPRESLECRFFVYYA